MSQRGQKQGSARILVQAGERIIAGRNCVQEAISSAPKRIVRIVAAESERENEPVRQEILSLAKQEKLPVELYPFDELTRCAGMDSHQGFLALVKERQFVELKDFIAAQKEREQSLVLLLDSINDPQNFGAILRAAECSGVDAVLWSKNRGADLTPVVSKVSVGASELVPLIRVANLGDSLRKLKDGGYWAVATAVDSDSVNIRQFDWPGRVVLLMGSEGDGLQSLLLREADFSVYIPMRGKIDSLNVSQATAVFLESYRRRHP